MIEKRFEDMLCKGVWDNSVGINRELTHDEVIDTLNNFQELSIKDLTRIENLEKENEELKLDLKAASESAELYKEINEALNNENEELKRADNLVECECEVAKLKKENGQLIETNNGLLGDIEFIKSDLKVVLPILSAIDFKLSINECEAINRLIKLIDDDFMKGVDCE